MKKLVLLSFVFVSMTLAAQPKVLSHRGLYTNPETDENSIQSVKNGQQYGVWGMEFDVHKTADGELIIYHNHNINPKVHCQLSDWKEIQTIMLPHGERIPTLRQWLEQARQTPEIKLALELKTHPTHEKETEVIEDILKLVRELDMMDQMAFLSFSKWACKEFVRLAPEAYVVLNSSETDEWIDPDTAKRLGFSAISYEKRVFRKHPEYIDRANEIGIDTYYWMVDTEAELDWAIEHKVSHITSNFPDKMEAMIISKCGHK